MQKKNSLDKTTIVKVLKGAGIAGGGVAIIYLLESLATIDFGQWTALVVGVAAILINMVKEWRKGE